MKPTSYIIAFAVVFPLVFAPGESTTAVAGGHKSDAGTSKAVTKEIIAAVADEIERAKTALRIPGEKAPYFIAHKLTEVDVNDVVASLGATTFKKDRHFVTLDARVHVGDYKLDNSNFVVASAEFTDGNATMALPVEATPRIARRVAWLVTDTAYKEALEQLRSKLDTRRAGGAGSGSRDSLSKQPAFVQQEPILVSPLEGTDVLEKRAQKISRVFRGADHVRDSRVAFTSFLERRWYINSEGTSAHDTRRVSGVVIVVTGQAPDGQELALYFSRYGLTLADLPGDDQLLAEARKLVKELDDLRKAPVIDNYTGPVLFEGVGAAGIVRTTLAPHLGGTPLPEGLSAAEAKQYGGGLSDDSIGLRVISPLLSVVDDPTIKQTGKKANKRVMIGGYGIDDEGVPAERVSVIENGFLRSLLIGRVPSKKLKKSNGHARRTAPGGVYRGSATNLILRARKGLTRKALVRKLVSEAKGQGLPYGLIIRRLDDAAITAAPELSTRELLLLFNSTDRDAPPIALQAYRVYPNGREELVRGVQLKPVQLDDWEDIIAVGRGNTVFNFLASGQLNIVHEINGVQDNGAVPSGGIESAVVTPDLLFRKLRVQSSTAGRRGIPLVSRP